MSALMIASVPLVHAQSIAVSGLTLPQGVNDIVWDGSRSRFFASSGANVLMINPETAQIEDTIPTDNLANKIAISDNGQYLYVANAGTINRYQIQNHTLDLQIALGLYTGGNVQRDAQAIVVLSGQPSSILVATTDGQVIVFDGAVPRTGKAALSVSSLYVRSSDRAIFGIGDSSGIGTPQVFWFSVSSSGVISVRSVPVDGNWDNGPVTWNGNLVANRNPFNTSRFDLSSGSTIGRIPLPQSIGDSGGCVLASDASGSSALVYQYRYRSPLSIINLVQYSLPNLQPVASAALFGLPPDEISVSSVSRGSSAIRKQSK